MCTVEKRGRVYLLTITGPTSDDEHRLNPTLLDSLLDCLGLIRLDHSNTTNNSNSNSSASSAALVTAAEGKFFSNGFDLAWAKPSPAARGELMSSLHKQAVSSLLSLPMPTVAAVTGHASAAGLVLALAHDHLVMRSDRGFLYMSETDIGLPIPDYFVAAARGKVGGGRGMRRVVLQSEKVTAREGVEMGLVDGTAVGLEGTVEAAVRMAEGLAAKGWDGGIYAANRMATLPELCRAVGLTVEGEEEKRKVVASKL